MSNLMIRTATSADIPQIMALQEAYQASYPYAAVIPGEVYLSAGFAGGKNVFCAFDETSCLQGYAPLFPNLTQDTRVPNTIWAEVKVLPSSDNYRSVKDLLFDRVLNRSAEINRTLLGRSSRLTFQYHPSELSAIEFVLSRACTYTESVYRMMRDLTQDLPVVLPPHHLDARLWRMQSEEEQQVYVQARNEAFPEAPISLADWQFFSASPSWQTGTTVSAFDGQELVGSVAVYWDDTISKQAGKAAGYTEYIFVRPKWRRRGVAPYLISRGLLYLKEHGRKAAFLEVKAANRHALDLYLQLGYQMVDETRLYVLELKAERLE